MKIGIIANARAAHQHTAAEQFKRGLERHGLTAEIYDHEPAQNFDLVACWGARRRNLFRRQLGCGGRVLVMERAYLGDRFLWTSLGFDGLNGMADFCNAEVPGDRAALYWRDTLKPWQTLERRNALVMGQCPGDASLRGLCVAVWANETAAELAAQGWAVRFRPHPLRPPESRVKCEQSTGTLADALAWASLVVTFNSNSGVDAVVAGVPTVALDRGSMAWDVAQHALGRLDLTEPARGPWLNRLAYCQWLPEEIEAGVAWDHLKSGMNRPLARGTVE